MTDQTYTIHLYEQDDGQVLVKAIDDLDNYQFSGTYANLTAAAVEAVVALRLRRLHGAIEPATPSNG